jgi:hypothetical protein
MRIDSGGNLGLGVTPSAWASTFKALQLPNGGSFSTGSTSVQTSMNAYFNTGWKYIAASTAANYFQQGNTHVWRISADATPVVDGAITWTSAMTLDASGNLGIGTSSPTKKLDVSSSTQRGQIAMSGTNVVAIRWATTDPNASERNWEISNNIDAQGALSFRTGATQTADPTTTRMIIDASGNLLVGVTSANANGGVLQLKSGITFPATQVAATDANTLDDYEEGTWTPAGGSLTNNATATYTKVGRLVHATFDITFPGGGAATQAQVTGLPFTVLSPGGGGSIGFTGYTSGFTMNIERTNTYFTFFTLGGTALTFANLNSTRFLGSLVYSV